MKKFNRITLIGATASATAIALAAQASAHVVVSGTDATQGGYGVLTFRVPSESNVASTTDVLVTLPDDHPIIAVSTQPKPGWTASVTKKRLPTPQKDDDGNEITDYISTIEWKADTPQAGIPPNQFDMFNIEAGPLPKEAMIYLPTVQTYSDGNVVRWDEKAAVGQPEPEHPAPMLMLSDGDKASVPAAAEDIPAKESHSSAWPGIAALAVGGIALLLGLANLVMLRGRRS